MPNPEPLNAPSTAIVGSYLEKQQCFELGFVKKMVELWKLRRKTYKAGETIMNKTMSYKSSYVSFIHSKKYEYHK